MTRLLVLAAAVLAAATAAGAATAEPGVSKTSILIGGTVPLSGEAAAFGAVGPGAKAYFDYVNANGGVFNRDIRYVYLDDAYDPAQTVQQTRRLVEQERVFAIFNVVGTEHTLATRPYLNELGVPQLFVGSGATALVREAGKYPWTAHREDTP
jgi:branched-chain amino acid transport system substrate-binding protein